MVKAIQFRTTGGPEVLKWEDVEVGKPARNEVTGRYCPCAMATQIPPRVSPSNGTRPVSAS